MPKIRKQPKRSTKKFRQITLMNPFLHQLSYLPDNIAQNIGKLDHIIPRHLDDLITEPITPYSTNIDQMKQALQRQQIRIKNLKQQCNARKKSVTQAQQIEVVKINNQDSVEENLDYGLFHGLGLMMPVNDPDWFHQRQQEQHQQLDIV